MIKVTNKFRTISFVLPLFAILFYTPILGQDELRKTIEQIIAGKKADIGISILNLDQGDVLNINGNEHFPTMSVFKFHIALAVLSKVDKGELRLNQKILIKKSDLLENTWSPFREKHPKGEVYITIKETIEWMISESDNNLCDVLIRLAGGVKSVESYIGSPDFIMKNDENGMHQSWDEQFLNTTTPNHATLLLKQFIELKLLKKKSTKFLYKAMVTTSVGKNRMKGKLAPNVEVAHRTGTSNTNKDGLTGAINDIGLVKLPTGKYFIIAVFVRNTTENFNLAEEIIADITKAAWDYYTAKRSTR